MKNKLNDALLSLVVLTLLGVQGCQKSPQPQAKPENVSSSASTSSQPPSAPQTHLKVGDVAPDFTLPDTDGKPVHLADFRGKKNVTLAFYVLAFTGGWTKELKAYQADIANFEKSDTQVIGISVDSYAANNRFKEDIGVTFPLLSDIKRQVVRTYGIFDEERFVGSRATFVIDKNGIIRHIEQGAEAIDPTGAYQACSAF
jgi:peroxiredoxin Q/BCP